MPLDMDVLYKLGQMEMPMEMPMESGGRARFRFYKHSYPKEANFIINLFLDHPDVMAQIEDESNVPSDMDKRLLAIFWREEKPPVGIVDFVAWFIRDSKTDVEGVTRTRRGFISHGTEKEPKKPIWIVPNRIIEAGKRGADKRRGQWGGHE